MNERTIRNPIIKGFNPDPSIIRVDQDYYIATSTFEWYPGIQIHHSRDLTDWNLIGHVLSEPHQLDLKGIPNSGGIWAPSLSHHDGMYYMVYTIVRTRKGSFKDVKNYLVTANNISGPWSEPIFFNSSGFDPSLFHDDNGKKWVVNVQWDCRKNMPSFAGIVLQEYNHAEKTLVGDEHIILQKDILIEGPNIYKLNGYYYLMLAQDGTGWEHSIAMARSKSIMGPYDLDTQDVVLTSRHDEKLTLQKAGHGELVQTPDGQWYMVHLCSRPIGEHKRCILGRETAIQKCSWSDDGWLRLDTGKCIPEVEVSVPVTNDQWNCPKKPDKDDFDNVNLSPHWASLRRPIDDNWISLKERDGWVRIYGGESLHSLFEQSLIVQRLQSFKATAETKLQFNPTHYNHSAGLICWYDTENHYYLRATYQPGEGIVLGIVLTDDGNYDELCESQIHTGDIEEVYLKAEIAYERLQFYFSYDNSLWQSIGPVLDMTRLSDDYLGKLRFTGTMVGICVQDLQKSEIYADFDYFSLIEKDS